MRKAAFVFLVMSAGALAQPPTPAAIAGSGQDEASVERGGVVFAGKCAACHGPAARGLTAATDLIRSNLVRTDQHGDRLRPFLNTGHPARDFAVLNDAQTAGVIAWLHAQLYGAANRGTYEFLNLLTGDARKGRQFFETEGGCTACHSATGDLARIGEKYDPPVLQSLWLNPRRRRGSEAAKTNRTVTVTPRVGPAISGTLVRIDEFNLVLRDGNGADHSIALENDEPRVDIHDPLQPHFDLYRRLTDAQIHDVTAYLASLK